jgi:FkbM family methyltransferase
MAFVTYAQNFEDLMLWRALNQINQGFYIDLGASEPVDDSVTMAFYERGWHGINIEPAPGAFSRLQKARPRDINLNLAVGDRDGEQAFYLVDGGNGLSTLDPTMRDTFAEEGRTIETVCIPVRRLADICREYVKGDVHFLKIDIEGGEKAALQGADLETWRPWIIVVEATVANTTIPTHEQWESLLLEHRYSMVYADGLNRFYLAEEHAELAAAFSVPPNVFDRYIRHADHVFRSDVMALKDHATALEADVHRQMERAVAAEQQVITVQTQMEDVIATLTAELDHATQEMWESNRLANILVVERQSQIEAVYASTSWRLTAPLRALARMSRLR